jgi:hypothetical protein
MTTYYWQGGNGDWTTYGQWFGVETDSYGIPNEGDLAFVTNNGDITITSNQGVELLYLEYAGATVDDSSGFVASALYLFAGTFNVDNGGVLNASYVDVDGGAFHLASGGYVENATIVEQSGLATFSGGATIANIVVDGVMNVNASGTGLLSVVGALTVNDATGSHPGVLNISNNQEVVFESAETLDNMTINLGTTSTSGYLSESGNGITPVLTLDDSLIVNSSCVSDQIIAANTSAASITNYGVINKLGTGELLLDSFAGSLSNDGVITASQGGLVSMNAATLRNAGVINLSNASELGFGGDNASNSLVGRITLQSGAQMYLGAYQSTTPTFKNLGTIALGGGSPASGADLIELGSPGLVFTNAASGVISGYGVMTIPTLDNLGAIDVSGGALNFTGAISGAGTLQIAAAATLSFGGGSSLASVVSGAGTLAMTGSTTIASGAAIGAPNWSITGSATVATLAEALTYKGKFQISGGATIDLTAGNMVLSGAASFATALVDGAGTFDLANASSVAGLTVGGTVDLFNGAVLTQNGGDVTLGDASGATAAIGDGVAGTWDITDNSGIDLGASTASRFSNAGLFEKTGGTGVSTVAASFFSTGKVTATTGTLSFAGPMNSFAGAVSGAGTVQFAGGTSTLATGATLTAASVTESGTGTVVAITENLTFANDFFQYADTTLSISAGHTLSFSGLPAFSGTVSGAGALAQTAGSGTVIESGAKITVANWSIAGANARMMDEQTLTYAGHFTEGAGATVLLVEVDLTLSGSASFTNATINATGTLGLEGATTLSGFTIGGAVTAEVSATATQSGGAVTIGDSGGQGASLGIFSTGTYAIADNSGITATATSKIANAGLFEKTGGTGTSVISAMINNNKTIAAKTGVLDLAGAINATGTDTVAASATLEVDSTVAAAQTLTYSGSGGTFSLNDLDVGGTNLFHGSLSGFAAGDKIDAGAPFGTGTTFNFVENGNGT